MPPSSCWSARGWLPGCLQRLRLPTWEPLSVHSSLWTNLFFHQALELQPPLPAFFLLGTVSASRKPFLFWTSVYPLTCEGWARETLRLYPVLTVGVLQTCHTCQPRPITPHPFCPRRSLGQPFWPLLPDLPLSALHASCPSSQKPIPATFLPFKDWSKGLGQQDQPLFPRPSGSWPFLH